MFDSYQDNCGLLFDLNGGFIDEAIAGRCSFNKFEGGLKILGYIEDEDDLGYGDYVEVGELRFHAYNLDKLGFFTSHKDFKKANKKSSLLYVMDMDSADNETYFRIFEAGYKDAWKDMKAAKVKDMDFESNQYLITFDRFYIDKEYRNQGIANYIHSHLFELLYTYFNITPTFMVGVCNPDAGEPEDMKAVQENIMKKHGFRVFQFNKDTAFCKCIYNRDFLDDIQM